jgi:hypothetical protein
MHHFARNREAEFNEVGILPKTQDATIMATAAYISANASNDDEHMSKLRALALEGVQVLQTVNEPTHDLTPRRNTGATQHPRHQLAAPAVVRRPHIVEPINGELRHGLAQHRVDTSRAQCKAHWFSTHGEGKQIVLNVNNDGLCSAECFSLYIRTTHLSKGLKISEGIIKFNGQQDPRIWFDDFMTAITVSGGSRDNALQLL